jgi:hypothetical protein
MKTRTITLDEWRRDTARRRAKSEEVLARMGLAKREKPRNPTEADFLRRIGTPERLIGPEA